MFVILNVEIGKYVARSGSYSSYTAKLPLARIFETRAEAESELCPENELILTMTEAIDWRYR